MPLYEFRCDSCGLVTEVMQRFDAPPPTTCEQCGGSMQKIASAPAIQFKGSGWYVTDYGGKDKKRQAAHEASSVAPTAPSESKPADGKPAESKPTDSKAVDSKPADAKPAAAHKAS
jgi:putative FmdB family regulatory protein